MKTIATSVIRNFRSSSRMVPLLFFLFLLIRTSVHAELPGGLIFRIQTEKNDSLLSENDLSVFAPIHHNSENREMGLYTDFIRAQKAKNQLREKGFRQLEIVAYFNKNKISIDDAFLILNNKNASDEKTNASTTNRQIDSLLALRCPQFIHYTIAIQFNDAESVNRFFELGKCMNLSVHTAGPQLCVMGQFESIAEAEKVMQLLSEKGFTSITLAARNQNGDAVSLDRAYTLLPQNLAGDLADQ